MTLTEEAVHIKDANQPLDAFYLPFESGWKRLDTGVINIAARTHMIGCTPAMVGRRIANQVNILAGPIWPMSILDLIFTN